MDERGDQLLMAYAQQAGNLDNILDGFFGFLLRRTDFFTGYAEKAKPMASLSKAFDKHWELSESKRAEEQKRAAAEDAKRKAAAAVQKRLDLEEYEKRQAEKSSKIEEVPDDTPVRVTKIEEIVEKDTEAKADEEDNTPPPLGNGGSTDDYTWTQTLQAVEIFVPVKPGTKAKEVVCDIGTSTFKVGLKGESLIRNAKFHDKVKPDDCMWMLVDNKTIHVTLEKHDGMKWWPCVCEGDTQIDTKKICPENSQLSDLDGDTRQTVEKMMYDQRAKAAGKPTSDQKSQHDVLEKFKKAHPEMDFSNAKINYGGGGGGMGDFNFGQ